MHNRQEFLSYAQREMQLMLLFWHTKETRLVTKVSTRRAVEATLLNYAFQCARCAQERGAQSTRAYKILGWRLLKKETFLQFEVFVLCIHSFVSSSPFFSL